MLWAPACASCGANTQQHLLDAFLTSKHILGMGRLQGLCWGECCDCCSCLRSRGSVQSQERAQNLVRTWVRGTKCESCSTAPGCQCRAGVRALGLHSSPEHTFGWPCTQTTAPEGCGLQSPPAQLAGEEHGRGGTEGSPGGVTSAVSPGLWLFGARAAPSGVGNHRGGARCSSLPCAGDAEQPWAAPEIPALVKRDP